MIVIDASAIIEVLVGQPMRKRPMRDVISQPCRSADIRTRHCQFASGRSDRM